MARKRMVVEFGMGTDLQGQDYTKAAVRALKDALWHNSVTIAPAFGVDREKMQVEVTIGVTDPSAVDHSVVLDVLPYGESTIKVVEGGLDIASPDGKKVTVIANASAVVYHELTDNQAEDAR